MTPLWHAHEGGGPCLSATPPLKGVFFPEMHPKNGKQDAASGAAATVPGAALPAARRAVT